MTCLSFFRSIVAFLALSMASTLHAGSFTANFQNFRYEGTDPVNAQDLPAGHFRNPILAGFRPDPAIVRVEDEYYLMTSSFSYWPGLPIFHSRDLVSWAQIGAAIDRRAQMAFDGLFPSLGIYGPDLKYYAGQFYALSTCVGCGGNFVITAQDPRGPWSEPNWLPFDGIDPGIFFDEDGRAFIVNNGPPLGEPKWEGHRAIWLQEFDLQTMAMTGPRTIVVDGGADPATKPQWIEGPHLIKRDGFYYLFAAEGGTGLNHSQVVFRSRSIDGPYMAAPSNPILTQRDLDPTEPGAIAAAGHADLVELPDGSWWATFLGVRTYGEADYNTGRDTYLLPLAWVDDWPIILSKGERVPRIVPRPPLPAAPGPPVPTAGDFTIVDDFRASDLAAYWTFLRTPQVRWWSVGGGKLTLRAQPVTLGELGQPSFLAMRQAHRDFSMTVRARLLKAQPGDKAGLAAFMDERRWFALTIVATSSGREVRLEQRRDQAEPTDGIAIAVHPIDAGPVDLRIDAVGGTMSFRYRTGEDGWRLLGESQDATILSTARAGGFTGVMIGPYANTAYD